MKNRNLKSKISYQKSHILTTLFTLFFLSIFTVPLLAATNDVCGILPCDIYQGDIQLGNLSDQVLAFIRFGFSAVFIGIIIFGIFVIIRAALKIIRSEGDEKEIEAGYKSIKGVWIGVGMIFVGIIGLLLIFAFFNFNAGNLDTTNIPSL